MTKFFQKTTYIFLGLTTFPVLSYAEPIITPTTFGGPGGLVDIILGLINIIIPAIFAVIFVIVTWKIISAWVIHGGEETKREEGKQLVPIAVLVFVLMLVTWGVVAFLRTTFFG